MDNFEQEMGCLKTALGTLFILAAVALMSFIYSQGRSDAYRRLCIDAGYEKTIRVGEELMCITDIGETEPLAIPTPGE